MGKFSGVLFFADYDHTLTDTNNRVPERNIRALREFMAEGGLFAVGTGRSLTMGRAFLGTVPCNAPLILFNGAMAYDLEAQAPVFCHPIDLDPEAAIRMTREKRPELLVEVQALDAHYAFEHGPLWHKFGEANKANFQETTEDAIPRPFLKFSMCGPFRDDTVSQFYTATPEQKKYYDDAEAWLRETFGTSCVVDRAAERIIDLQAKGTSKGAAALELKERLGAKVLVCAGDGKNDLSMLQAADLPFVPADAVPEIRAGFPNVAPCDEGSIADVIARLPAFL